MLMLGTQTEQLQGTEKLPQAEQTIADTSWKTWILLS